MSPDDARQKLMVLDERGAGSLQRSGPVHREDEPLGHCACPRVVVARHSLARIGDRLEWAGYSTERSRDVDDSFGTVVAFVAVDVVPAAVVHLFGRASVLVLVLVVRRSIVVVRTVGSVVGCTSCTHVLVPRGPVLAPVLVLVRVLVLVVVAVRTVVVVVFVAVFVL